MPEAVARLLETVRLAIRVLTQFETVLQQVMTGQLSVDALWSATKATRAVAVDLVEQLSKANPEAYRRRGGEKKD